MISPPALTPVVPLMIKLYRDIYWHALGTVSASVVSPVFACMNNGGEQALSLFLGKPNTHHVHHR